MALKKGTANADKAAAANEAAAASTAAGGFESMDDAGTGTDTVDAGVTETSAAATNAAETGTTADLTPASADEAAAAVQETVKPATEEKAKATSTAVAQVKQHALATATKKFVGALSNLENVFDPAQLDFNTFPRVVVGLDGFSSDSDDDLGKEIGLEVLSFNTRFTLSPGVDSEEAKPHVRFSLDGKVLDCPTNPVEHGMAVVDYLEHMRTTLGYKEASMKEYVSIYGFMTFAKGAVIDPSEREIVGVQVPPQSRPLFDRYKINQGLLQSRGVAPKHAGIRCQQEKVTGGNRKYAQIKFAPEKDKSVIDTFFNEEAVAAAA